MSPLVAAIAALVLGALLIAVVFGSPILAIPVVLVFLGALGGWELWRRSHGARDMKEFRDQAKAEEVEFTARDKRTQV